MLDLTGFDPGTPHEDPLTAGPLGLVPRSLRAGLFLFDHAPARIAAARRIGAVPGPVVDVRPATEIAGPPRRPQHQVGDEAEEADHDQDPADGVHIDGMRVCGVHGEREDEAHSDEDDADYETHARSISTFTKL